MKDETKKVIVNDEPPNTSFYLPTPLKEFLKKDAHKHLRSLKKHIRFILEEYKTAQKGA